LRTVQVGHRNGVAAEILAGLRVNDRVVVHPSDALTDGVRVSERSS
jgi:HlyD family secretion protein